MDASAHETTRRAATGGSSDDHDSGQMYVISVAAELSGMHAQTLRSYDRMGLVSPLRTRGGGRRYSARDIEMLRQIQHLSQEEGVNLAGVKAILELTQDKEELTRRVSALEARIQELLDELDRARSRRGGELVPTRPSTAVVMWQPRRRTRRD